MKAEKEANSWFGGMAVPSWKTEGFSQDPEN